MNISPCVQSAVRSLPENVTASELIKYLFSIHPEYVTEEVRAIILTLEGSEEGDRKKMTEWLQVIATHYPNENLLHSGLVIVGLFYEDPTLHKLVTPQAIASVEARITFTR